MEIQTSRFGSITISDKEIIQFTQPILGFGRYRRYTLVEESTSSLVRWLQSIDDPDLAFLVIDPMTIVPDYEVTLHPDDLEDLGVQKEQDAQFFTLLVVSESEVRTNLKAPIVFNPGTHKAKQVVLHETDYPIRFILSNPSEGTSEADAGSHT